MKKEELWENQIPMAERAGGVAADDRDASDLLQSIERSPGDSDAPAGRSHRRAPGAKLDDGPVAIESVYFRSFGEHPLLNREQEIALAKRIDQGNRAVREGLRAAIKVASRMRKTEPVQEALQALKEIKGLSGLSAVAISKADATLGTLLQLAKGPGRIASQRVKQLTRYRRQIRETRVPFERAKSELVRYNLRLVVDIAKHYVGRGLGLMDLIQEGNIGLMKATERYKHQKGFKFSTYATWWIRQGITRSLADQSRTIRIPVHMTEASQRILRTSRRLVQQLGRDPRTEEVGTALRVRPEKIRETMQVFLEPTSLDNPIGDGETPLGDLIADRQVVPPDAYTHRYELTREMDRILAILTPREQTVIRLRFGIGQDQAKTLEQVGRNLSVTRERIRQIEAKALKKLKAPEIRQMFSGIR
ncbi:MAG: RNA polymerase sigma factor RpoD/SigA [Nitrospiraceae bacterium]